MKGLLNMHKKFLWTSAWVLGSALCLLATVSIDGNAGKIMNESGDEFTSTVRAWVTYTENGVGKGEYVTGPMFTHTLQPRETLDFSRAGLENDSFANAIRKIQDKGGKIKDFAVSVEIEYKLPDFPLNELHSQIVRAHNPQELLQKLDSAEVIILPGYKFIDKE